MNDTDSRLEEVLARYLEAKQRGEQPDRASLLARHADLAADLEAFFRDHDRMEAFAAPIQDWAAAGPADAETLAPGYSHSATPPLGSVRYFGDFELLREIARGGMGVVYQARQVSLDRAVALKMMREDRLASDQDVERFRREAEAVANLDQPGILPIYEVGAHDGRQYFAMKLAEGGSLAEKIEALVDKPKAAVELLARVCRAVHYAHQRGILHRDLKPANILLDKDGAPFVTDFGLAKQVEGDSGLTESGAILGTPRYMAPEQAMARRDLSTAVDVWALGAILYELLTGRPPFRAATSLDTLMQVLDKEPERPSKIRPRVDRDLETMALKCLHKDPAKRYRSAEAMAEDLERWQRREPITARRVGLGGRLWRWCRRKPALAAVSAVAIIGITAACVAIVIAFLNDRTASYHENLRASGDRLRNGWRPDALLYLHKAGAIHRDEFWRGAAINYLTAPYFQEILQVHVGDKQISRGDQDGTVHSAIAWTGHDQVRITPPGSDDVQVWRVPQGELLSKRPADKPATPEILLGLPAGAKEMGRARSGRWAVLRSNGEGKTGGEIVSWDVERRQVFRALPDVGPIGDFVCVSDDGRRLAYMDPITRGVVRVWDWDTSRFLTPLNTEETDAACAQNFKTVASFSPDGELLVTQGYEWSGARSELIWQVETGQRLPGLPVSSWGPSAWSPDGRWLATGGWSAFGMPFDGTNELYVHFWEVHRMARSYTIVPSANAGGYGIFAGRNWLPTPFASSAESQLALSPDGCFLASRGTFWRVLERAESPALEPAGRDFPPNVQFMPDGSFWSTKIGADAKGLPILEFRRERRVLGQWSLPIPDANPVPGGRPGPHRRLRNYALAPDGHHVLLVLEKVIPGPPTAPGTITISMSGPLLGCRLEWWDFIKGKQVAIWNENHEDTSSWVRIIEDGSLALIRDHDGVTARSTDSGAVEHRWPGEQPRFDFTFSSNGRYLARYNDWHWAETPTLPRGDGAVEVYETAGGQLVKRFLPQSAPIALSNDGRWLLCNGSHGTQSGSIELWDVKGGEMWARWEAHRRDVQAACFSADGKLIVTLGKDNVLHLWPLEQMRAELDKMMRE